MNQCWPYPPTAAAVTAAAFAARVQQHSNSPHSGHMVGHPMTSPGNGAGSGGVGGLHPHHPSPFGPHHAHSQLQFRTLASIFGPAAAAMFTAGGHMPGAGVINSTLPGANAMSSTLGSYMAAAAAAEWKIAAKAIQHNYTKMMAGQQVPANAISLPEAVNIKGSTPIPAIPVVPAIAPPLPQLPVPTIKNQADLNVFSASNGAEWNLKNAANTFSALNSKMNSTHISAPNLHLNHSNSSSSSSALSPPQHHMFTTGK